MQSTLADTCLFDRTPQGFAVKNEHLKPLPELLKDTERIDYYRGYLKELTEAMSKGMRCDGYMAWSFIDNFEWKEGYIPAFGAVHVDRKNGEYTRTPKESTRWLKAFWDRAVDGESEQNGSKKTAVKGGAAAVPAEGISATA